MSDAVKGGLLYWLVLGVGAALAYLINEVGYAFVIGGGTLMLANGLKEKYTPKRRRKS